MRRDGQALPCHKQNRLAINQLAGANLGSLQVGKDADGLAFARAHLAHHADQVGLLLVRAVRKIQARHIKPGAHQLAKHVCSGTSRTKRPDDLCAATCALQTHTLCHCSPREEAHALRPTRILTLA